MEGTTSIELKKQNNNNQKTIILPPPNLLGIFSKGEGMTH